MGGACNWEGTLLWAQDHQPVAQDGEGDLAGVGAVNCSLHGPSPDLLGAPLLTLAFPGIWSPTP